MTVLQAITLNESLNLNQADPGYSGFKADILEAINAGRGIRLKSYTASADVEMKMDAIIHFILQKYQKIEMKALVYTIVKELMINATKANLKRVFFLDNGLNIRDHQDYESGTMQYKETMVEEIALRQGVRARELDFFVLTDFRFREEGLRIELTNTAEITSQEEERLRKKLERVMQYDSMLDFYMDNHDPTEGAGLGLAMIVTMLKSEGIDPSYFRIFSEDKKTIARLEIPFSESYTSVRDKFITK